MTVALTHPLFDFLRHELAVPEASIASALERSGQDPQLFPIVLWQYDLITLEQLDQIFDWLAVTSHKPISVVKSA